MCTKINMSTYKSLVKSTSIKKTFYILMLALAINCQPTCDTALVSELLPLLFMLNN